MQNRIHTVFFTPLFYMYYPHYSHLHSRVQKKTKKKKNRRRRRRRRETPLYTLLTKKKSLCSFWHPKYTTVCVCPFLSLFSLSFFLSWEWIISHSFIRKSALLLGCVALERRGIEESDQKKRRGVQEAEENGLGVVLFFVFVLREERKTSYIIHQKCV